MTASSGGQELHRQAIIDGLAGLLRCPVCKGSLSIEKVTTQQLICCLQCARRYPVVDDLPVLIPEKATLETADTPDPSQTADTASH